jgi:hypothetical protein
LVGLVRLGLSGEVVCLLGLVGSEDLRSMLQVPMGLPEVVFQAVPFEPNLALWLFVLSIVGNNVFHLRLRPPEGW